MSRCISRIEDVGEAVIGRFYSVPAVQWVPPTGYAKPEWADWTTPVFGGLHEDKDIIGFKDEHWHVDWRFVSALAIKRLGCLGYEPSVTREQIQAARVISVQNTTGKVFRVNLKCKRPHLHFPSHLHSRGEVRWLRPLEDAYAEASAKCGRCPHRGMSLAGAPVVDGARVCPGHGLAWNIKTGNLQRRTR